VVAVQVHRGALDLEHIEHGGLTGAGHALQLAEHQRAQAPPRHLLQVVANQAYAREEQAQAGEDDDDDENSHF
jgi:hypothetical protein